MAQDDDEQRPGPHHVEREVAGVARGGAGTAGSGGNTLTHVSLVGPEEMVAYGTARCTAARQGTNQRM